MDSGDTQISTVFLERFKKLIFKDRAKLGTTIDPVEWHNGVVWITGEAYHEPALRRHDDTVGLRRDVSRVFRFTGHARDDYEGG